MFVYVNIFAFVLDRVLPFQNPMKMIDKDAQGLEHPNNSLGRNLELHDEVMQPCMENFPSYKNVDQEFALLYGPWMSYNHYLTVRAWSPNFYPVGDVIEELAVWVHISGLPIKYYDSRVMMYIGNKIGKTIKVDKNMLTRERGKYACLCIQVNLLKPLLVVFSIKGRHYQIKYEGLHILILSCGRFGHLSSGCANSKVPQAMAVDVGVKVSGPGADD
ncbi:hypothetical protein KIW84_061246 [Lathyrus oleraceus]|uniref:DUF4283 domain-containing protein n=1 Tax=Pisum sativum TaxID=3888 RepID=A0A9D5A451_PEA|nr:hypothetical protein KIW84_061246 [Pisum sativum]